MPHTPVRRQSRVWERELPGTEKFCRGTWESRGFGGVFLLPIFMEWQGLPRAEMAAAIVSALGLAATVLMLPEAKGRTLEELNEEALMEGTYESPAEKMFAR